MSFCFAIIRLKERIDIMAKLFSILGLILLILVVAVLWFWLIGWAVGILLSLFGISVAHSWWSLVAVGLATSLVGGCIGKGISKNND